MTQDFITTLQSAFITHSAERRQLLRMNLEVLYQRFRARLAFEKVDEKKQEQMLKKARKRIEAFFPNSSV